MLLRSGCSTAVLLGHLPGFAYRHQPVRATGSHTYALARLPIGSSTSFLPWDRRQRNTRASTMLVYTRRESTASEGG
jgi:hypothetical protein